VSEYPETSGVAESWDTYWHGARESGAYSAGGTSHPLVLNFWGEYFKGRQGDLKIVDIASGNGAVLESASAVFGETMTGFTCVDISESAIATLRRRFPDVDGIVADANSIPLGSEDFDIATSQFGLEYAGLHVVAEIARLVTSGGELALLLHHRSGGIYRQCAASRDAIEKLQQAGFVPGVIDTFDAGFAAIRGADRSRYEATAKKLVPAIRAVESIMEQHGTDVADGTIVRLYKDVRTINGRLSHYDPSEVMDWLGTLEEEIAAYAGRMSSMCDVALGDDDFATLCTRIENHGFELKRANALTNADRGIPLAWSIIATRN